MKLELLKEILASSKEFYFENEGILVIKKYYDTDKEIKLDLSKIDDEMLEKIIIENESEDDFDA